MRVTFIPEEMPDEMKSLTLILALGQVRGATPEENVEQVSAVIDGESVIRSFINLTVLSPEHFAQDARLACAMLFDIGGASMLAMYAKEHPDDEPFLEEVQTLMRATDLIHEGLSLLNRFNPANIATG